MEAVFARLRSSCMLLIASIGLVVSAQAVAQTTSLEHEQAKIVSKFAKYVNWPSEARQRKFIIGVYEDVEKYNYFNNYFANKGVRGKDISVLLINTFTEAKDVNILYLSSNKRNLLSSANRTLSGSHVLLITEDSKEPYKSMVDIAYNAQDAKITFTVNDVNMEKEDLAIPDLSYFADASKTSTTAGEEAVEEEILPPGPTFLLEQKHAEELLVLQSQLNKQKETYQQQINQQKSSINQLNKELSTSKQAAEKNTLALQKQSDRISLIEKEDTKKSQELKSKDQKLQALEKQLATQQAQLKMNKEEWQVSNEDTNDAQEKQLAELTEQLKKQKDIANNSAIKLQKVSKENDSLTSFQMLFYVFVIIALLALVVAFLMWKKAKEAALQPSSEVGNENNTLLPAREEQLIKSENFAALGYLATDITYAVGVSLDELQTQFQSDGDTKNANTLKPIVTLLENFNLIAADQDDTDVQSFNLIDYVQKMVMLYEFEFNQSDIVYNYSGEQALTIKSVPSYIAIILINVINNSLKHGFNNDGNGKIALKIEKGAKGGAKITYSDDGKGMNKATLDKVFTPFFTTQSSRGYVGVGMSTTQELVKKKLSGDIKIDSQAGKGTTVVITLP